MLLGNFVCESQQRGSPAFSLSTDRAHSQPHGSEKAKEADLPVRGHAGPSKAFILALQIFIWSVFV